MPRLLSDLGLGLSALAIAATALGAQPASEMSSTVDCDGGVGSWAVEGVVVEYPTGEPVAHATVTATGTCVALTDRHGRFWVRSIPVAVEEIRVSALGYLVARLSANAASATPKGVAIQLPIAGLPPSLDTVPLLPETARAVIEAILSAHGPEHLARSAVHADVVGAVSGVPAAVSSTFDPAATVVLIERPNAAWIPYPESGAWLREWKESGLLRGVCQMAESSCQGPAPVVVLDIVALIAVSPDSVYVPLRGRMLFGEPDPCVSSQLLGDVFDYTELLTRIGERWERPDNYRPFMLTGGLYSAPGHRDRGEVAAQECPEAEP